MIFNYQIFLLVFSIAHNVDFHKKYCQFLQKSSLQCIIIYSLGKNISKQENTKY